MNNLRKQFDSLVSRCLDAGLPAPQFRPGRFDNFWEVEIKGYHKFFSKRIEDCFCKAFLWASGFLAAKRIAEDRLEEELARVFPTPPSNPDNCPIEDGDPRISEIEL